MANRLTRDRTRFRKTYSFYRQEPRPATLYLEKEVITIVSETIVREGTVFVDQFNARPSPSFQGAVFYCTDVCESFFYSGSQWLPFFGAGKLGTVPPSTSSWTPLSSYGTGTLRADKDAWLFHLSASQQPPNVSDDPAVLAWIGPTTMTTGTVTTVTLAVQNTTPLTSSLYVFGGMYADEGGVFALENLILSVAGFNPQNEDRDVVVVGGLMGLESAPSASAERGSNQEVWLRFQVTSSVTSSFTGSVGGNGGTVFRPISQRSFVTVDPTKLHPAVGFVVGGGLNTDASFRVLSYDEVQVSA